MSVGTSRQPTSVWLLDLDEVLEPLDGEGARLLVLRQEAHGHRVVAGRRQVDALPRGPVAQQRVGDLDQAAGAVAHQRVGADGAAVVEVDQDLQALARRWRAIFRPLMSATKPTPQESCSLRGS